MTTGPAGELDNPIERLELLAGDDEAISSFLDQIDVTGPRDREMLGELARTRTLADLEAFPGRSSTGRRRAGDARAPRLPRLRAARLAGPVRTPVR